MLFKSRQEAARRLAERLARYRGSDPLILAIPRGAVEMGQILAEELGGELDVVLVRKIGAPCNPEFAIGSVAESGEVVVGPWAEGRFVRSWIDLEARRQLLVLQQSRQLYTPGRPPADPEGRVVILVDDGVATGSTLLAALEQVRVRKPGRLIAAMAVASARALDRLAPAADEVVCLAAPEAFRAVSQYFEDFRQVSDDEVMALLAGNHDPVGELV